MIQLLFILSIYIILVEFCYLFQDWWDLYIETNEYPTYLSYIPRIMLALIIAVLDDIYSVIAIWLNDSGKPFIKLIVLILNCLHQNFYVYQDKYLYNISFGCII